MTAYDAATLDRVAEVGAGDHTAQDIAVRLLTENPDGFELLGKLLVDKITGAALVVSYEVACGGDLALMAEALRLGWLL